MKIERVLITGVAGFIGSNLLDFLIDNAPALIAYASTLMGILSPLPGEATPSMSGKDGPHASSVCSDDC